ncbi:sulfopyruvate decarboxylase subunit alpha [Methanosphaerula palustris]|uniref:sulfopyruvate decarboxylase n=1 Tax=Methanosphaerula palustris (strain ATCC BAA-1556 / DSM 19958 / E1-9c) TaxID=521011 RepID=B8GFW3_METPE|nr:sulfopyruvate decarboxylase subunit alpha [Methanosphaerula palustris]ACL17996.1 thiamine pyrophosphate binding domain-containing protein [Methanosphaerula palustris E1-9c]
MHETDLISILSEQKIDLAATLPCDRTKDLCSLLTAHIPEIPVNREEDGVGVCAGAALGGSRPALVIQSSGLGNSLNALMSLTMTYRLPLPIIASWRGFYHEAIPAQVPFNRPLPAVLDALGIPYQIIREAGELGLVNQVIQEAFEDHTPSVALISPKVWEGGGECATSGPFPSRGRTSAICYQRKIREPVMTRSDAIGVISGALTDQAVVANIGMPSKELYVHHDRPQNFYMLGSYTQATPVGFGLASVTDRDVWVIDGDGSMLGTGILPAVGAAHPPNLRIFCLDNGAFGSTGNQPTYAATGVDIELMARAAGIISTVKVQGPEELAAVCSDQVDGPLFVHVLIRPGNTQVPNIPLSPEAIRDRFIGAL